MIVHIIFNPYRTKKTFPIRVFYEHLATLTHQTEIGRGHPAGYRNAHPSIRCTRQQLPRRLSTLYLADVKAYGEFNPDGHKKLLSEVITKRQPDMVVFSHSSYGWDLASHIALAIQVAEVVE